MTADQQTTPPPRGFEQCPVCGAADQLLVCNEACYHNACETCLRTWVMNNHLTGLRVPCHVAGCHKFLMQNMVLAAIDPKLEAIERKVAHCSQCSQLQIDWMPVAGCNICADHQGPLLDAAGCGHQACSACWDKWFAEQLSSGRGVRQRKFSCICCPATVPHQVVREVCPEAKSLCQQLERRRRLQQNHLFPLPLQVNCPQPDCVGLGYLGFDTIMCFLCEHQWPAEEHDAASPSDDMPRVLKCCPSCKVSIEKHGGCDHMTCPCRHEFSWTTLLPWRQ